ncbi:OB-fold-containig protein [Psychrosphaera algicola]
MPKEESSAVSKESFAGLLANITVGTAKLGQPAEAMIRDEFNQKHYVLVEPIEEDEFSQGENVVLVVKEGSRWLVTRFD